MMKYLACIRRGRLAVAAAMLYASGVQAQVLIQPVVPEFAPRHRIVSVTVTMAETAPAAIRLQAQVLRWHQDAQGQDLTEPSSALLVSPPLADLKPGQKQVFRIALRQPRPLREEATYRLVLEDVAAIPVAEATGEMQAGLHIRMKYDLPVMVEPEGKAVQALRWKPCPAASASSATAVSTKSDAQADVQAFACVRIANTGNRRIRLAQLNFAGDGWQHEVSFPENGALVLAGAERDVNIPAAPGRAGLVRSVQGRTARGETVPVEPDGL